MQLLFNFIVCCIFIEKIALYILTTIAKKLLKLKFVGYTKIFLFFFVENKQFLAFFEMCVFFGKTNKSSFRKKKCELLFSKKKTFSCCFISIKHNVENTFRLLVMADMRKSLPVESRSNTPFQRYQIKEQKDFFSLAFFAPYFCTIKLLGNFKLKSMNERNYLHVIKLHILMVIFFLHHRYQQKRENRQSLTTFLLICKENCELNTFSWRHSDEKSK